MPIVDQMLPVLSNIRDTLMNLTDSAGLIVIFDVALGAKENIWFADETASPSSATRCITFDTGDGNSLEGFDDLNKAMLTFVVWIGRDSGPKLPKIWALMTARYVREALRDYSYTNSGGTVNMHSLIYRTGSLKAVWSEEYLSWYVRLQYEYSVYGL